MMLWYTARGAGLTALVLLTLATCAGALVSRQPVTARTSAPAARYVVQYLHRTLGALGLAALVVHVTTIVLDSYADVGLTGALVPFASGYRPLWVTLGVVALWLTLVVAVLGFARGRVAGRPRWARAWRAVHALSYLGWASAVLHGLKAGTDTSLGWVRVLYVACIAAVAGALAVRAVAVFGLRHTPGDRFAGEPSRTPARVR